MAGGASAAGPPAREYEVKAGHLYNFARFVEWPPDAFPPSGGNLVIGVLGEDPFGEALDREVAGKTVHGRPVVVRRLDGPEDAVRTQILFVCASEAADLPIILRLVKDHAVLTVGDSDGFADRGGIIGFRTERRQVRFTINASSAAAARLRISSQLLKLARVVGGVPAP